MGGDHDQTGLFWRKSFPDLRIALRGALAEDAAARVAEAWQKAGDARRTAQAARHYQQMYPTGRYLTMMRGLVGKN
jgi:hypothetical protein